MSSARSFCQRTWPLAAALILAALGASVSSCRQRSIEQYCNQRQDRWEAAYSKDRPDFVGKSRRLFVKTCEMRFGRKGTEDEFRCRSGCLDEIPRGLEPGSDAAKKAYRDLQRCEAVCPGEYCIGQPAW